MFERLPPHEGDPIHVKFYTEGKLLCQLDNYYFKRATYQGCFEDAGFQKFSNEPLTIEDDDAK